MGRIAMDQYFKLLRAPEEITRCNVEIRRIITHLRDEEHFLRHHEDRVRLADPVLAHQIAIHRNIRGRFNSLHRQRLAAISKLKGFSGNVQPGISLDTGPGSPGSCCPSAPTAASFASANSIGRGLTLTTEEVELEGEQQDDEEEAQEQEDEADLLAVIMDKANSRSYDKEAWSPPPPPPTTSAPVPDDADAHVNGDRSRHLSPTV
ncbi:hypothetical protein HWV62_4886 [Athelia sp. TMB]|nr:hypothetical protein HWV62_4886 [Athelia sp. TMB]